ncbi:copper resistance CopC/CopD family protein [Streptomyces sp. NPDC004726]
MRATAPRFGPSPARPHHRLVRLLLAATVLLGTVLGSLVTAASPAAAHAALTGSNPKDGAVVPTAPKEVTLTFSEPIAMGKDSIRVLEPSGKRADRSTVRDISADGKVAYTVDLLATVPNGTYTVAWQAVSADSHPVSGAFTFSIGAPSKTEVALPDEEAGGGLVGLLYDIARYAAYAGFLLMTGAAAFILVCWRRGATVRPVQRLVAHGWVTLTAATLAMLLLRTPYTGSGKLADAFDLGGLQDVLETKTGAALISRLLLLGAAALFIAVLFGAYAKRERPDGGQSAGSGEADGMGEADGLSAGTGSSAGAGARTEKTEKADRAGSLGGDDEGTGEAEAVGTGPANDSPGPVPGSREQDLAFGLSVGGVVVSAGLAATWALSEHASTGIQTGLAMPLDVLHLLAAAGWLGGLAALLTALHRAPVIDPVAVRRFSTLAFVCVVTLAATGIYQSWRQLGSWSALTETEYGQLLLVKVALVVVMVAVAGISRRWTAQLAEARDTQADGVGEGRGGAGGGADEAGRAADTAHPPAAEDGKSVTVPGSPEAEAGPSRPTPNGSGENPARAAQLARQRAAIATTRKKKARDADPVRSGMRRSVLAEAGIAVVVLAVTTVLTATEPGRTEEEAGRTSASPTADTVPSGPAEIRLPFNTGGRNGKGTVRLTFDPARPGPNEMRVWVDGADGKPLDAPEVKVSFTLEDKQIGPLPVTPDRVTAGHWSSSRVQIPMPGDWRVKVTVRTSDIDQTTIDKNMKIG